MQHKINETELLKKLISIPSPFFHEENITLFLEEFLQGMGFKTQRQEVKRSVNINGKITEFCHFNVLGEKGEGEKSFLLYGHIDTVPPVAGWKEMKLNPFIAVERDGIITGLGADDMKGGVVSILKAMEDLEPEGYKIKVAFGVDEEYLSMGAHVLVNSSFLDDVAACIVPEVGSGGAPQKSGNLVLGRHGRVRYGISITGRAAHASTPEHAVNPIKYAMELIEEVEKVELGDDPDMPPGNVSIAAIRSEIGGLSSPEECMVWFDFLYSIPMRSEGILSQLRKIIHRINEKYITADVGGTFISLYKSDSDSLELVSLPSFRIIDPTDLSEEDAERFESRATPYQEPFKLEADTPLFEAAAEAVRQVMGEEPVICYGKSNADENYFAEKVPTIVIPPVGGNEHQAGEYIVIESMENIAKIIRRTVINFASSLFCTGK